MAEWDVHESSRDETGVEHVVLRSPDGELQYTALHSGQILTADPDLCSKRDLV